MSEEGHGKSPGREVEGIHPVLGVISHSKDFRLYPEFNELSEDFQ